MIETKIKDSFDIYALYTETGMPLLPSERVSAMGNLTTLVAKIKDYNSHVNVKLGFGTLRIAVSLNTPCNEFHEKVAYYSSLHDHEFTLHYKNTILTGCRSLSTHGVQEDSDIIVQFVHPSLRVEHESFSVSSLSDDEVDDAPTSPLQTKTLATLDSHQHFSPSSIATTISTTNLLDECGNGINIEIDCCGKTVVLRRGFGVFEMEAGHTSEPLFCAVCKCKLSSVEQIKSLYFVNCSYAYEGANEQGEQIRGNGRARSIPLRFEDDIHMCSYLIIYTKQVNNN